MLRVDGANVGVAQPARERLNALVVRDRLVHELVAEDSRIIAKALHHLLEHRDIGLLQLIGVVEEGGMRVERLRRRVGGVHAPPTH